MDNNEQKSPPKAKPKASRKKAAQVPVALDKQAKGVGIKKTKATVPVNKRQAPRKNQEKTSEKGKRVIRAYHEAEHINPVAGSVKEKKALDAMRLWMEQSMQAAMVYSAPFVVLGLYVARSFGVKIHDDEKD